jgi:hypothetical protein
MKVAMHKVRPVQILYVLECTEYERGWDSKNDGYVLFIDQAEATRWATTQLGDRSGAVPDYYVNYTERGFEEAGPRTMARIEASPEGRIYIDRLSEMSQ